MLSLLAPQQPLRAIALSLALLGSCASLSAHAAPSSASQRQHYQIAAGPLSDVLARFAAQSGVQLSLDPAIAAQASKGLNGNYTVGEGFAILLTHSALELINDGQGNYTIRAQQITMLPAVDVTAIKPLARVASAGDVTLPAVEVSSELLLENKPPASEYSGQYKVRSSNSATGLNIDLKDTPQTISVITHQQIQDQNLQDTADVLAATIGLSMSEYDTERQNYYSRGFTINPFQFDGLMGGSDFANTLANDQSSMSMFDRVEVIRGASGLLTAEGNPSATLNFIRKRGGYEQKIATGITIADPKEIRAHLDISTPLNEEGNVRARLIGEIASSDSFMQNYNEKNSLVYAALDIDLNDQSKLGFGISHERAQPKGITWGGFPMYFSDGSATDWDQSINVGADWTQRKTEMTRAFADYRHNFGQGWELNAAYQYVNSHHDDRLLYVYNAPDKVTGLGIEGLGAKMLYENTFHSADLRLTGTFELLGREHKVIAGAAFNQGKVDYDRYNHDEDGINELGSIYTWNGSLAEPIWNPEKEAKNTGQMKSSAIYAATHLHLFDPLKLILGMRITNFDATEDWFNEKKDLNYSGELTPYAGVTYAINPNWSAYASYTSIFKPQFEKNRNYQSLDPIRGANYETGIKGGLLDNKLQMNANIFRTQQDNLAVIDPDFLFPDGSNAYLSAEGATSTGFEIEVNGALSDNWNIGAGYAQFNLEDKDGVNLRKDTPNKSFKLFTTYAMPSVSGLTIGGGLNWYGKIYGADTNPITNQSQSPVQSAYALFNLMAKYEISKTITTQLNISNLFNKKYYTNFGTFYDQGAYGEARKISVSLNSTF